MKALKAISAIIFLLVITLGSMGCDNGSNVKVNVNVCDTGDCDVCPDGGNCNTDIGVCTGPDCREPDYGQIGLQNYLPTNSEQEFQIKYLVTSMDEGNNFRKEDLKTGAWPSIPVVDWVLNDVPVGHYLVTVSWRPTGWSGWVEIDREILVEHNEVEHVTCNIGDKIIIALDETSPSGFRQPQAEDEVLTLKAWGPAGSRLTRLLFKSGLSHCPDGGCSGDNNNYSLEPLDIEGTTVCVYQANSNIGCGTLDAQGRINSEQLRLDPNGGNISIRLNSASFPLEAGRDEFFTAGLIEAEGVNKFNEIISVYGPSISGNLVIY